MSTMLHDQKCCFFNWNHISGDCNLFSHYDQNHNPETCHYVGCHFISGLRTCDQGNLTAPGFCMNGQNHKTTANNLSHLPRNTKFDHQSHLSKNRFNRHGFYPGRLYPLGFYLG